MPSGFTDDFTLTLGGAEHRVRWGLGEVIEMQERLTTALETPTVQEMDSGIRRGRLKYLRAMLLEGLRPHNPLVTESMVTGLMQQASEDEMKAALKAFGYSVRPDPVDVAAIMKEPGAAKRPRKAQTRRKTGARSTGAPADSV